MFKFGIKSVRVSKHQASKKGFSHPNKRLSKGELAHQNYESKFAIIKSIPVPFQRQIIADK